MVINIVSNQTNKKAIRGPKKVLINLLKGLDLIGVEYVLNQPISKFRYNWIQDSLSSLIAASLSDIPVLLGPNLVEMPNDLPLLRSKIPKGSIYLHPSKWTKDKWLENGFKESIIEEWPVGIDTTTFGFIDRSKLAHKVLIYFKNRKDSELKYCINLLNKCGLNYSVLKYGEYTEEEFLSNLFNSTYCIWIGIDESQGIALQEVLSTNLPIIIVKDQNSANKRYKASPAPYFSSKCGIILDDIDSLNELTVRTFDPKIYNPRNYILENLSLEICAREFLKKISSIKNDKQKIFDFKCIGILVYLVQLPFHLKTYKSITRKIKRIKCF